MLVANPTLGELVLLGGGHAHVEVLRAFGFRSYAPTIPEGPFDRCGMQPR